MNFHFAIVVALALLPSLAQPAAAQVPSRFKAPATEQLTTEQKAWADSISGPPRNADFAKPPYRAYLQSPELAKRLSALSDYLRWNSSLKPRLSEMAILIAARHWTAQYEWFAHYPLALKAGLDPSIAGAISAGKRPDPMQADEAALYDLATELYRDKHVTDATYKAAFAQHGERGIMDIIGIIGYYDLVSMTLITMEAKPPNDSVPLLPPLGK